LANKRKRESSVAAAIAGDSEADEEYSQPAAKIPRIEIGGLSREDVEKDSDIGGGDGNEYPAGSRTPAKRNLTAGGDASAAAAWQELVSPNKRVQFNMKPMPPTPGRRGGCTPRRSILKTPSKATPLKSPHPEGATPRKAMGRLATPVRLSSER
jgi:hypothetical protein